MKVGLSTEAVSVYSCENIIFLKVFKNILLKKQKGIKTED